MRLTQGNAYVLGTQEIENSNLGFKESKTAAASSSIDKLKASNFPASILRIGSWEVTNVFVFSVCIIVVVVILAHGLLRVCVFFFFGSISRDMKVIWWRSVTLRSISWFGKFLKVVLRARLKSSGLISWL